ncbi:hypothetical protein CXG81DRAFT_12511 [Caulochytrium protostelioides]|uniref:Phosphatidylinositol N-acetylglucosaminyltransferase GPI3 subunit n=1 Tax=Caulochytrium protostelioides TaxID=1555241 RepID=A0A4P9WVP8_9FUNG|nr:UDP-Glycosyltransferase/glycogen phosphorylase [Caulochytrium protostelioides]RKP01017.1 hypothetical protein CXG81DRAFT_12511 [Caulochytrium protostelioides]|eukprot:RKP01017.1 hypothetical protein CXG81DRAFT_12511 [Caulochytrium protostelioides]
MVSDFFWPNMGGVEGHVYDLSQRLAARGHRVTIVTHRYNDRVGVRYLSSFVKVYYIPTWLVFDQVTWPTVYGLFPILRQIMIREHVDIVHGHQAFSAMCHEAILHARTMGLRTCFTDHSLFGFADTGSILTNKLLKFTLSDVDGVICVSHTSKENTVLRAAIEPDRVSVIPNAIIAANFTPDWSHNPPDHVPHGIAIIVVSRLVYRKGIDLLVSLLPRICQLFPDVNFIIAGDGPKLIELEQVREKYILQDRIQLLGSVNHGAVRSVLVRGQIFLNCSLTEAFCIAMVEAASCGLLVVSTSVGGVPEVLPDGILMLSRPDEDDLVRQISRAIHLVSTNGVDRTTFHERVKDMYSWGDVAARTETVYAQILDRPPSGLAHRLVLFYGCGLLAGKIAVLIMAFDYLVLTLLNWIHPSEGIDRAPPFVHTYSPLAQREDVTDSATVDSDSRPLT